MIKNVRPGRQFIRAEGLGKSYRVQHGGERGTYRTLREDLAAAVGRTFRLGRRGEGTGGSELFWALRDVSFSIQPGEVLGIVGRNGAGKSTLLKILSRVTKPTAGEVEIRGRVGSLLEVGTGFHPELTGRENVFLNGSILGMSRREIARRFDEIVAFSEVERFIDTPVKRYSSGMYVRLAFSVAIHLRPQILIIDEVLAVGDLSFQAKCMDQMRSLTRGGMSVILVSHNLAAIQSVCTHAILMEGGKIAARGTPKEAIDAYRLSLQRQGERRDYGSNDPSASQGVVTITRFAMMGEDGEVRRDFRLDERIQIRIDLKAHRRIERPMIDFGIKRGDGVIACNFNNWFDNFEIDHIEGECTLEGWLPPLRLIPDFYEAHVLVWPWGGAHLAGDIGQSTPLAATIFGDFQITGPDLNEHDGVFQIPAERWRFSQGGRTVDYEGMNGKSIYRAFEQK